MSSKRFLKIEDMFHLLDNNKLTAEDGKVAKIALLYRSLNGAFVTYGVFHSKLSFNESIVPYFGRHSCQMFIRGQPIRFGYKTWCLCGSDTYPYHLSIYTSKSLAKTLTNR